MNLVIDAHIYRFQQVGGVSRLYDNILPILCDIDPSIRIILFHNWDIAKVPPKHQNISVLPLNKYDNWFRPWRLWHKAYPAIHNILLKKKIGSTKGKIWFSTYYTTPPFHWDGKQIVFTHDLIHEMFPDILPNSKETISLKNNALMNADAVICNSRSTAHDLQQYYPVHEEKIFIAELGANPIFTKRSISEIKARVDFPFILYVGRRDQYKGFWTLLDAYRNWQWKREIKLIVVGPQWSTQEQAFLDDNFPDENIILKSMISDNELCDHYNQAKAFIFPSSYEGFGIPLLEAMVCGCPIIASDIPSTKEVAKETPIYFQPTNSESLLNALNCLTDTERILRHINIGLEHVKEYSWKKTACQIYQAIKGLS